jgi:hypothetical protein
LFCINKNIIKSLPGNYNNEVNNVPSLVKVWVPMQETAHPHYFKGCLGYEDIGQRTIYLIHYLISEGHRVSICVVEYWNVHRVDKDAERYKIVEPAIGLF